MGVGEGRVEEGKNASLVGKGEVREKNRRGACGEKDKADWDSEAGGGRGRGADRDGLGDFGADVEEGRIELGQLEDLLVDLAVAARRASTLRKHPPTRPFPNRASAPAAQKAAQGEDFA